MRNHARPFPAPRAARARLVAIAGLISIAGLAGCPESPSNGTEPEIAAEPADSAALDRRIRDLITAVSPLAPDATAMQERDFYQRRTETLERDRAAGPALARKALDAYRARPDAIREVRAALLDVAAHGLPADARPILVELVTTYGEDLGLRKAAVGLLEKTSPETALELLEPLVMEATHRETYPPQDALLSAWLGAADALERDPVPVLSDVATNPRQDDVTRNLAIKALGRAPSSRGRQALEAVLVESGGNHMARRYAAQSLAATVAKDELCPLLERVFGNEADVGFQQFLAALLEEHCR
jgi:hypothetical protein